MLVPLLRTFRSDEFDAADLVAAKAGRTISLCLPARDEQGTVGAIVGAVRSELVEDLGLVDEIVVVDDHSTDRTAAVAADAGALVVAADEILPSYGLGHGKGEALWKSLAASSGDLVVWCDADVRNFEPSFVVGLVGPLLTRNDVGFVKGFYDRPEGSGTGGGRVTELVARPVISLLCPQLAGFIQPLAGEYAGRRELLEQLPFVEGYGVDLGLLLDIERQFGLSVMAQVDLGERMHRNRPLEELSPQAMAVIQLALHRAAPAIAGEIETLVRPGHDPIVVDVTARPPLVEVPEYRRSSA
jgi:glucosyl-3-phosphoglycerate synthase